MNDQTETMDLRQWTFNEIRRLSKEQNITTTKLCYLGFTVIVSPMASWNGHEHEFTYYPIVYNDQSWVWEAGCSWPDKGHAITEAFEAIDNICDVPKN